MLALVTMLMIATAVADPVAEAIEESDLRGIVAVVVEQHGQVVYERRLAAGSNRRGSEAGPHLHDIRSAGKSLTALAVGAAIADGHLPSVDEPVWALLGATAEGRIAEITVRDLLTMSSALDCNDWDRRRSPGFEERMYRRKSWRKFVLGLPEAEAYTRDADGFGRFSYCTAGVFLLGQVVEQVTGEPFDRYVERRVLAPLGIEEVVWRRSRSGEVQSGGQVEIGPESLTRIGRLVLDGGEWQGERVLPKAWVDEMLTPHRQIGTHVHYGYLWWATVVPSPGGFEPTWYMSGNGGNVVAVLREYDAVIVVQAANYNEGDASDRSFGIVMRALSALKK